MIKKNHDSIYLFSSSCLKMQNIHPEQIYDYVNNIISFDKAKKLNNICLARCIFHITTIINCHNESFTCHCFKCRVWQVTIVLNDIAGSSWRFKRLERLSVIVLLPILILLFYLEDGVHKF